MSEEKKHTAFTADDIEKYHKGQLSGREMHALERAALEDSFLAEALEGYSAGKTNASADLEELKQRLGDRIQGAKIVNIPTARRKEYFWMRAAAMVILIAGAGFLVYQFALNKKSTSISELKAPEMAKQTNDSIIPHSLPVNDSPARNNALEQPQKDNTANARVEREVESAAGKGLAIAEQGQDSVAKNQAKSKDKEPVASEDARQELATVKRTSKDDTDLRSEEQAVVSAAPKTTDQKVKTEMQGLGNVKKKESEAFENDRARTNNNQNSRAFRGKVTDPNNNPIPFANITNERDKVNTYADASGFFNLSAPDSVLDVQVRSVGFENNNAQLRSDVLNNQVILQGDRNALNEVVVISKNANANAGARKTQINVEQPEPSDGWENYDAYLLNNISIPEEAKARSLNGDVRLSFDISKKGNPINIKVEKSLCVSCDQEAIRLVQTGPKWNRKTKKTRATVKVPF